MKVTFIGAGSSVFAKNVLGDTMLCPTFYDMEIALYDINADRLEESFVLISKLNENINEGRATVKTYLGVAERWFRPLCGDCSFSEFFKCERLGT